MSLSNLKAQCQQLEIKLQLDSQQLSQLNDMYQQELHGLKTTKAQLEQKQQLHSAMANQPVVVDPMLWQNKLKFALQLLTDIRLFEIQVVERQSATSQLAEKIAVILTRQKLMKERLKELEQEAQIYLLERQQRQLQEVPRESVMLISDLLDELLPLLASGLNKPVPDGQFMLLLDQPLERPVNNSPDAENAPDNSSNTVELQTDSWLELFAEQKLSGTALYAAEVGNKDIQANLPVIPHKDEAVGVPVIKSRQADASIAKEQSATSFSDPGSAALVQLPDGCTLLWASHASGASGFQILQPSESQFKSSDVNFKADVVPNIKAKNSLLNQPFKSINPVFFAVTQQHELYQLIEEQVDSAFEAEAEVDMFMQSSWTAEFQQSEYQREHWFFDQQSDESATLYYRNYFQPSAGSAGVFPLPASGLSQAQQFVFNGTLSTAGELNAG